MDIYKLKFTILQEEMLRLLFVKAGMSFNARGIAKRLDVSPTAIAKSLKGLEKAGFIRVKKDEESGRLSITLNRDNPQAVHIKRAENLKMLYESGLCGYLSESFPGAAIILFGSYSFGEDTVDSDIDIAVVGSKAREQALSGFEKLLERKIVLNFYESFGKIDKNLKENILNGIVLKGGIRL